MQHQLGFQNGLSRGDSAGAKEGFLGDQVGMATPGDIDQAAGRERPRHRITHRRESLCLAGNNVIENMNDPIAITPQYLTH